MPRHQRRCPSPAAVRGRLGPALGGVVVGQRRARRARPGRGRAHQLRRRLRCRRWPASGCGGRCAPAHPRSRASHQAGAGTSERQLDQRRPEVGDVAQDPVVAQQQHRRRGPEHQPQPAAVGLAREHRPVPLAGGRGRGDRPERDRPGCRSAPAPSAARPRPRRRGRRARCRRTGRRGRSPAPRLTTRTSTGPSRSLVPETQVIAARPRVAVADRGEVGDPPARAQRPGQVRREAARSRPGARRTRRTTPRLGPPERRRPRRGRGRTTASPARRDRRRAAGAADRESHASTVGRTREAASRVPRQDHRGPRARGPAARRSRCPGGAAARRTTGSPASGRSAPAGRGRARTAGRPPAPSRHRATTRSSRADTWSAVSPPGHGCGPDRPARHRLADLVGGDALVVAVGPLDQVLVDLGVGEPGQLGGTPGALPRARSAPASNDASASRGASARAASSPSRGRAAGRWSTVCRPDALHSVCAVPDQPDVSHEVRYAQSSASTTTASPGGDRVGLRTSAG